MREFNLKHNLLAAVIITLTFLITTSHQGCARKGFEAQNPSGTNSPEIRAEISSYIPAPATPTLIFTPVSDSTPTTDSTSIPTTEIGGAPTTAGSGSTSTPRTGTPTVALSKSSGVLTNCIYRSANLDSPAEFHISASCYVLVEDRGKELPFFTFLVTEHNGQYYVYDESKWEWLLWNGTQWTDVRPSGVKSFDVSADIYSPGTTAPFIGAKIYLGYGLGRSASAAVDDMLARSTYKDLGLIPKFNVSGDIVSPQVVETNLDDGYFPLTGNAHITFNEPIQVGSTPIFLQSATGGIIETLTSSRVIISGNVLTIDFATELYPYASYSVTLTNNAIQDVKGNRFRGGVFKLFTERRP